MSSGPAGEGAGPWPEVRALLEAQAGALPVHDPAYDVVAGRVENRRLALAEPRVEVASVRDLDAGGVSARLYVPPHPRPGVLLHAHGGGFVFHDVDVHDNAARRLCLATGLRVLSVDYRLAPEHPFPAAVRDLDAVLAWLEAGAGPGGEAVELAGPLHLHGDSAGANLVLGAALRHPGRATSLVLVYPFLEPRAGHPSYAQSGTGFTPAEASWYWERYTTPERYDDPDVAPLRSQALGTLPPTLVVTAECDPLRDEGELLARRAAEAGVDVVGVRALGQVHGFWRHPAGYAAVEPVLGLTAGFLAGSRVTHASPAAGAPQGSRAGHAEA